MPEYRSRTTTHGRNQAGSRALWRATGMKDGDFDKPMIAAYAMITTSASKGAVRDISQLISKK